MQRVLMVLCATWLTSPAGCLDAPVPRSGPDTDTTDTTDTDANGTGTPVPEGFAWSRCGYGVEVADLDGDGVDELIFLPRDAVLAARGAVVLSIASGGAFRLPTQHDPRAAHVEDLDDDGTADVLLYGTRAGTGGLDGVVSAHFDAAKQPDVTADEVAPDLLVGLNANGPFGIVSGDVDAGATDVLIADATTIGRFLPASLSPASFSAPDFADVGVAGQAGAFIAGTELLWASGDAWFALTADARLYRIATDGLPLTAEAFALGGAVTAARRGLDGNGDLRVFGLDQGAVSEVVFDGVQEFRPVTTAPASPAGWVDLAVGTLGAGTAVDIALVQAGETTRLVVLRNLTRQGGSVAGDTPIERSVDSQVCHAAIGRFLGAQRPSLVLLTNDGKTLCFEVSGSALVECP